MESGERGWIQLNSTAISRRKFLGLVGLAGIVGSMGIATLATVRSLVPNVLYEPSTRFRAGKLQDFTLGSITFIKEKKVYIQRDEKGLFAMSAICTHLGCTVPWLEANGHFECPCHGGKYHRDGHNFAGPPPRPLDRLKIELDAIGRVTVDTAKVVDGEYRLNV
ncbi:MAG: ubiquinol-cytochrome c reductase iron-sulfur subunit [Chloroflexi bacterium]|nr:ubiquinol-cytochrome c reductase iron-sulfur subunit [Chloroflexota bacterium]